MNLCEKSLVMMNQPLFLRVQAAEFTAETFPIIALIDLFKLRLHI